MRWIVSILVSAAFMAGVVSYYTMWRDVQHAQVEAKALQRQINDYEKVERMYAEQREKLASVNRLWSEIESVGLHPKKWVEYPLSIGKTLAWNDLEKLMLLTANKQNGDYYWFKSDAMRVTRVLQTIDSEGNAQAVSAGSEGEARLDAAQEAVQRYETRLKGTFLIPKEAAGAANGSQGGLSQ